MALRYQVDRFETEWPQGLVGSRSGGRRINDKYSTRPSGQDEAMTSKVTCHYAGELGKILHRSNSPTDPMASIYPAGHEFRLLDDLPINPHNKKNLVSNSVW